MGRPVSNLDYIRSLGPEGFTSFLENVCEVEKCVPCGLCPGEIEGRCDSDCCRGIIGWLEADVLPSSDVWKDRCGYGEKE